MDITVEMVLLALSLLFFASLLVGKAGSKYGVPILLLFLGVGMFAGMGRFGEVFHNNYELAQAIGTIALSVILFSGGLDTKMQEIRPVMAQGVVLATIGVLLTAVITGLLAGHVFNFFEKAAGIPLLTWMLLAAVISSTDSASVFSILRSKGVALKNDLRPLLELESGSNDPVAYMLTICLISIIMSTGGVTYFSASVDFVIQFLVGAVSGYLLGRGTVYVANHIRIDNASLYPILTFTAAIFIFSFTYFIHGNGFLAVYISGLVIGNSKMMHKRSALKFFDGLAWLSQILMFLTLGLLVKPKELMQFNVMAPGLIISALMIFVARPMSVFACLLPFRVAIKDQVLVSWVGLRGAVPIIFAILPLAAGVPHADFIFHTVFFMTLVSLLIQGTSLSWVARKLGLEADKTVEQKKLEEFDIDFCNDIGSITSEITINETALAGGHTLLELPLPDKAVAVMVKRGGLYFVPTGDSHLHLGDILLIITDCEEALAQTHRNMGVA
jgi:cell volume regulation protein A